MVPYEQRIKLDEKSTRCVMFGVSKESKAYRLYNPETKKIIISRDVKFDEGKAWDWEKKEENSMTWEEMISDTADETRNEPEAEEVTTEQEANETSDQEGNIETDGEPEPEEENHGTEVPDIAGTNNAMGTGRRNIKSLVWMKDYVCHGAKIAIAEEEDEMFALLIVSEDTIRYEDVVQEGKWKNAMEAEIKSIEDNNTWELVNLPD